MSSEEGDSSSSSSSSSQSEAGQVLNLLSVADLERFLLQVAPLLFDDEAPPLQAAFTKPLNRRALEDFISNDKNLVLAVKRTVLEDVSGLEGKAPALYSLDLQVNFSGRNTTIIGFIKKPPHFVLEADKSPQSQLHILNLGNSLPFETLHSFIHSTLAPFFRSFAQQQDGSQQQKLATDISVINQKISELEVSLYHCTQEVQIGDVDLPLPPEIVRIAELARRENRTLRLEDFDQLLAVPQFLPSLQQTLITWIKNIDKVTKLDRIENMPNNSDAAQEIKFWIELDRVLQNIQEKIKSPEFTCMINLLKRGKKFFATTSIETDTDLKPTMSKVDDCRELMKDFPIDELLTASDLKQLANAVRSIFSHLIKRSKSTKYPDRRFGQLIEALSRDLKNKLIEILNTKRVMDIPIQEFEENFRNCQAAFKAWTGDENSGLEALRELYRKKSKNLRFNPDLKPLSDKLVQIRAFRRQHEELKDVLVRVLPSGIGSSGEGDMSGEAAIERAYEVVRKVDVFNLTKQGAENWDQAVKLYDEAIDAVEQIIIQQLHERLGQAQGSAQEMFRVFAKFNALFVRPRIRGAVLEYQKQLLEQVHEDIKKLHETFVKSYSRSEAARMSNLRDLPPVSGSIIWARQIQRQLDTYMQRVEAVLGQRWETDVAGQTLKAAAEPFRQKLKTDHIFEQWCLEMEARNLEATGRLLNIVKKRNVLFADVNFDENITTLFKESRNLQYLGYRIPFSITMKASKAKRVYPIAVSLRETVRLLNQTLNKISNNADFSSLLAFYRKNVQQLLQEGFKLKWENLGKLNDYVPRFSQGVATLRDKVDNIIEKSSELYQEMQHLKTCPLRSDSFAEIIQRIQTIIDELNLLNYSNLDAWVNKLDSEIETMLLDRLKELQQIWVSSFSNDNNTSSSSKSTAIELKPQLQKARHFISIRNQVVTCTPPLENARITWLAQLNNWLGVICYLPRIQSSRYDDGLSQEREPGTLKTYRDLLKRLPEGILQETYGTIENKLIEVQSYVQIWLEYQALWDMEVNSVFSRLGDDLSKWQQILVEIQTSRKTFDTSLSVKDFGSIVIDYAQVQASISNKYDYWHKEILYNFGLKLGLAMQDFYDAISKARQELEQHSVDVESTIKAVQFILQVQDLRKKLPRWEQQLQSYNNGQDLLRRQRYQFPKSWLDFVTIEGEWTAFSDILNRKYEAIQSQLPSLQMKIVAEGKLVEERLQEFYDDWAQGKPLGGVSSCQAAIESLKIFEGRLLRLKEDVDRVRNAKEALDLEPQSSDRLPSIEEELLDLKGVWSSLADIWAEIDQMKFTSWNSIVPRQVRRQLEDIQGKLKALPSRMRQYNAYEHVSNLIKDYLRFNVIIGDLRSEALRERHWKELRRRVNATWVLNEMTLGDIWDSDIKRYESVFKEIILRAQGELALEEFLRQIREYWEAFELDLVGYQNKCTLIRGWDDLFLKLTEHSNSINAMKASPYYKVFEEQANSWDDKLNRIRNLFDVWIDVQRRWVYLEGIFAGSADIASLLPVESGRFKSVNTEFIGIMKKVSQARLIVEVVNFEGIQRTFDRIADLLTKIQKALGEYLERQRSAFPRFYFVGDEDLLEIIGNSKDIDRLQKHLKKMFAGLSNLLLDEERTTVLGMASREGEEVQFKRVVSIKDNPKINEWLTKVEHEMRFTLASLLEESVEESKKFESENGKVEKAPYLQWVNRFPSQLVTIGSQILWTKATEHSLNAIEKAGGDQAPLVAQLKETESILNTLADQVLLDIPTNARRKYEQLITELVHQRDVLRKLIKNDVKTPKNFEWLNEMRFYWDSGKQNILHKLSIQMANATFYYGYEYLGVSEKLVQTPLTDRCYLTLTQALESRMGGSPFGPAGTGKTETVKALGNQLGRLVIVFCCDEGFDFQAMTRIFVGLCQCGAWGCFDEFNRLEERILSAVSQQIQTIQVALKENAQEVELLGRSVKISSDMGVFITMNPGYAGRSNLPDNLKQLFRGIAMIVPDRELIAQVMLYSQGFKTAERLSSKIVPLFKLCVEQLSDQSHYDFGLRALKSVLVSAGNLKRSKLDSVNIKDDDVEQWIVYEQDVMLRSICETIIPKLVAEDIPLFSSLLSDVFPGSKPQSIELDALKAAIKEIAVENYLVPSEAWIEKQLQLYSTQFIRHGVMVVGPSGSGKSTAWRVLLEAMQKVDGVESVFYHLDPKAIDKDDLFGTLEPTTREWSDGLFTHLLRKIIDNIRGESNKRHWILLDGDVDPEWVENLNSLLDDNKLLTLPNGERLALPSNVRVVFEVENLRYATPATVSRCGMVWFSEDTVSIEMLAHNYLTKLRQLPLAEHISQEIIRKDPIESIDQNQMRLQQQCAEILAPHLQSNEGLIAVMLQKASEEQHIMDFTRLRAWNSLISLINKGISTMIEFNNSHSDFPLSNEIVEKYLINRLTYSVVWAFGGGMPLRAREQYSEFVKSFSKVQTADSSNADRPLLDYFPTLSSSDSEWVQWSTVVPMIEIESSKAASPDVVIETVDTVRHVEVLHSYLAEHRPLLLCGPPGSGKSMTLTSTLKAFPEFDVITLNFSSATTPDLILKTFDHHCECKRTPKGNVLRPREVGKWLVVFCDEINLPTNDKYGTQRVITFLRQLIEQGGYWRTADHTWIILERIQFVGACNPPTDPGRVPLSHRFLRFAPLLLVDFPAVPSLHQIYGTFSRALLKQTPQLRQYAQALTHAMVDVYSASQQKFTPDIQSHYIYSPRELSRWIRALNEALKASQDSISVEELVRIWAHEGLRLFQDRLVELEERNWTDKLIDEVAQRHFPSVDHSTALKRPILYSNWLTKDYVSVEREDLREYVKARLRVFAEEELDVSLVVFNEVLDHILRIDRVFRQPQGHVLLIGVSGGGKTVLSRFVAWLNGMTIFTIKVNNRYTAKDFDDDLRTVMKRSGCQNEKVCFIFDESNVLDSAFLERMNTLLASGEVPGLFEGDEYSTLMHQCRESAQRDGLMLDSEDELYKHFTNRVRLNLHVVFTMNPASPDFHNRAATSPALYNRCVLDWFGEWPDQALFQVASEFTRNVDIDDLQYRPPNYFPQFTFELPSPITHRDAVISSLVFIHNTIQDANVRLARTQGRQNYVTPRHYLDFISHFVNLVNEKREELEEQQLHLNIGLQKLRDTQEQVATLQASLREKNKELEDKNLLANAKLKQMVDDQQIAEAKKKASIALQAKLDVQEVEINEKRRRAMSDLDSVQPMIEQAKLSVSNIHKKDLDEIRALASPPPKVRLTIEAVLLLLGKGKVDWKDARRLMMDREFIPSIVNFQSDSITPKIRQTLEANYLTLEEFNYEAVNRASKACGPLVQWTIAQCRYSEILQRVQPLRDEVDGLEQMANSLRSQQEEMRVTISSLEESINRYKDEYAVLISETQSIKTEMKVVQDKVERSVSLLQNLSSEQGRWETESQTFEQYMATLVGDCLLNAAFLAYSGFFDQQYRSTLMRKWKAHLLDVNVSIRDELSVIEYLSHPDERLGWQSNNLPSDDLAVENAIMLHRFNRYPLVIDPSGQASEFLMAQYREKKIIQTSFLDSAFMKNLESALRFGTPLLVHDVESIDPVLNPVLNKEIRKQGGRILIRLGDQDIDFSPSFVIFLATRDPTAHFTPDLCSRVTFVNFTVTRSSLRAQCLASLLKAERPDIEQKRTSLLKAQGEFRVRLRNLEKALLTALNESQGNILDDNKVMNTLVTLKNEALDIQQKVSETEVVFEEITRVSAVYDPLAVFCSRIYFAMEQLATVHFLYQFSLRFFLEMFNDLLYRNDNLVGIQDHQQRLDVLVRDIFSTTFIRVCRTLLHEDQVTFALRLAQIRTISTPNEIPDDELQFFMKGGDNLATASLGAFSSLVAPDLLSESQVKYLLELQSTIGSFKNILPHVQSHRDEWQSFMADETSNLTESDQTSSSSSSSGSSSSSCPVPLSWEDEQAKSSAKSSKLIKMFRRLLVLKGLRPDRVVAAAAECVKEVFGAQYLSPAELDLVHVVEKQSHGSQPIILCSAPGHDASNLIDELAVKMRHPYKAIALGSPEGFDMAEKAIQAAVKSGNWVLLKNIHLAPAWLVKLEKKLHSLQPHNSFRLFMTSEIHPKLPKNLLRQSQVFSFESPPGIKANLINTFGQISIARSEKKPVERTRLHFMLAWLHAIIQERLRYSPLGWSKMFEFGDSDKRCALETIDTWLDSVAQGRDNLSPDRIPWTAIRTLLSQTVYGGRIDNTFDQRLLDSFLDQFLNPHCFDEDFALVSVSDPASPAASSFTLTTPEGTRREQFGKWIDSLPSKDSPSWLGLPANAELLLLVNKGKNLVSRFLKMQSEEIDDQFGDDKPSISSSSSSSVASGKPTWAIQLLKFIDTWAKLLPQSLKGLERTADTKNHPIFRFFEREIQIGSGLLSKIQRDLKTLGEVCEGHHKQTNYVRSLMASIDKALIPQSWRIYTVSDAVSLTSWLVDFIKRIQQLQSLSDLFNKTKSLASIGKNIWLGGLFNAEAFMTATRQSAARANNWSLESLVLHVSVISDSSSLDVAEGFVLTGLHLEAANWSLQSQQLSVSSALSSSLPPLHCRWRESTEEVQVSAGSQPILLPVYLNENRLDLLFSGHLSAPSSLPLRFWYQRGVAILSTRPQ
eukprot:TRINITY_DN484_c0_g1_i1.p1 TRINITY_DN484_c0_g1~~TRINITY_DN484_c0_g1_i1.p1  ORF type:complete len:4631 (+),score=2721.08 TRINITY_DN484_c0_g1_i1:206-14098(+)